jgi:copper chaperone CopZ
MPSPASSDPELDRFIVVGMTCDHCVRAVTDELSQVPGVRAVTVDLATGLVEVRSDAPLPLAVVRAAVDGAGFTLDQPAP